jgi:hypothetical protein
MKTLPQKAAAGTTGFLIVPAALTFISAGKIRFWQGWLFGLTFSLSVIVTTTYLLRRDPALVERCAYLLVPSP